jgi:hypothetical protein
VGGQVEGHRGAVLCYAPDGTLLAREPLGVDDHAFRPAVRFVGASAYVARTAEGLFQGVCPEASR